MAVLAAILYASYFFGKSHVAFTMANLLTFAVILILLFHYVLKKLIHTFQNKTWPALMAIYERQLRWVLKGYRPVLVLMGMIALFFVTIFITGAVKPTVLFFPNSDPNSVFVYVKMPGGTHQNVTDSVVKVVESRVYKVIGQNNPDVESVISNITIGAEEEGFVSSGNPFNRGKVTVNFIEHKYRSTQYNTTEYMELIRKEIVNIAGAEITVDKEQNGPPTGKPINIEITNENL